MKRLLNLLFLLSIFAFFSVFEVRAASTNVTNEDELQEVINQGDDVNITSSFNITKTITIPANYRGIINANQNTLTATSIIEDIFNIKAGAQVVINDIKVDGNNKARHIQVNQAKVTINNSTFTKGTTQNFEKVIDEEGVNAQKYQGGSIYASKSELEINNTIFSENTAKNDTPLREKAGDPELAPHGGAIFLTDRTTATIKGGQFIKNKAGFVVGGSGSNGEGGAIKVEGASTLTINEPSTTDKTKTIFRENSAYSINGNGGRQGGSIEVTESTANIYGASFEIRGPFDTGGAIKFEGAKGHVANSDFLIPDDLVMIGVAGGAITSENSELKIEDSTFKAGSRSHVQEAGGLIQVVGRGKFDLINSTLTGGGTAWNKKELKTAQFGGAINFYNGSSVVANITDTTISGFNADISGGGIAVGNRKNDTTSVNLTLTNTKILDSLAYSVNNGSYGGGMFVSGGSTVEINGGEINSNGKYSSTAGAIFNEGSVTLQNGAIIRGNRAYFAVGGILNDGYLKVDDATIENNAKGDWSTGDGHYLNRNELGGENIYAKKDVIITPNAKFDNKDVRVIDKQSSIILTGTRTSKINVSISENEKQLSSIDPQNVTDRIVENAHRYVGYTVAKGDGSYTPTKEDANMLHYVTKDTSSDQIASTFEDTTSTGKWDYVLNPEENTIVLGQRAKIVFHSNHQDAQMENSQEDSNPQGKKAEKIYTFYKSGANGAKMDPQETEKVEPDPTLEKYTFMGWYKDQVKNHPLYDLEEDKTIYENFDFSDNEFLNKWHTNRTSEITKILDVSSENTLHTYAAYETYTIRVNKVWIDGPSERPDVQVQLYRKTQTGENKTVGSPETLVLSDGAYTFLYEGIEPKDPEGNDYIYSVDEVNVPQGYIKDPNITKAVDGKLTTFTITNTYIPSVEYTVNKVWVGGTKPDIQVQLYRNGQAHLNPVTLSSNVTSYTWENLEKLDENGATYTYSADEVNVPENYTKTVEGNTITNTYTSPKITYSFEKVWVNGPSVKPDIQVQLYRNDQAYLEPITLSNNQTTYTFTNLDETDSDGNAYTYRVDEVNVPENYTKTVEGNVITNTYTPPKTTYTVNKVWVNGPEEKPEIQVKLSGLDSEGNTVVSETATLTSGQTSHTWTVDAKDSKGNDITYSVDEISDLADYTKSVNGNTITNTYSPELTSFTAIKAWVNGPSVKPTITFKLYKVINGEESEAGLPDAILENGTTSYTWNDIPSKDDSGNPITYTFKEVGEVEGYTKSEVDTATNTITNTFNQGKTSVTVNKIWVGGPSEKPSIQVQLLKGEEVLDTVELANGQTSYTWNDLFEKEADGSLITYSVKEVSELENYETSQEGFTITNTYRSPKISHKVEKTWVNGPSDKPEIRLTLYRNDVAYQGENAQVTLTNGQLEYTWETLDKNDMDGNPYKYEVKESPVYSYETTYENQEGLTKITNTYLVEKFDYPVTKIWVGGDTNKPAIKIQLYKNNIPEGEPVVLENGTSTHTFTNLDKTDINGTPFVYTVDELEVPSGYTKEVNGNIITNIFIPSKPTNPNKPSTPSITPPSKPSVKVTCEDEGKVWDEAKNMCVIKQPVKYKSPNTAIATTYSSYMLGLALAIGSLYIKDKKKKI